MRRVTLHSVKTTAVRYHSLRSFLMLPRVLTALTLIEMRNSLFQWFISTEQTVFLVIDDRIYPQ